VVQPSGKTPKRAYRGNQQRHHQLRSKQAQDPPASRRFQPASVTPITREAGSKDSKSREKPETADVLESAESLTTLPVETSGTASPGISISIRMPKIRAVSVRPTAVLLTCVRLGILGVGLAALGGTMLNILQPRLRAVAQNSGPKPVAMATASPAHVDPANVTHMLPTAVQQGERLGSLEQQLQQVIAARPGLTPSLFFLSLDSGQYVDLNGSQAFPAASTIKSPILVALFQDIDAGKIRLDEQLVMRPNLIATEAGSMQYQPPNSKFSVLETATLMITISDNTATNMLIDRLGGAQALNQRFKSWGLQQTTIRNWLPDLNGTNMTSARDQATVMYLLSRGELVSARSRDRIMDMMRHTVTNTLLPAGLGEGAQIAHKTGDIGTVIGDAGIIDTPNGQRYVGAVMVRRPFNDVRGRELVQEISRLTYRVMSQPLPTPQAPASSSPAPVQPAAR
jgi:beta-lactamase class A